MSVETKASSAEEVAISGSIPTETAQHLQRMAEQEGLTVAEIVERAVEEYVQSQRFRGVRFVTGGSGRRKAVVWIGNSVWGIVFNAQGFDMDAEKTADHLRVPVEAVRLALDYYAAYPEDTDARLQHMKEVAKNPYLLHPNVRIMKLSDLDDETVP